MKLIEMLEPNTIMVIGLLTTMLALKEKGESLYFHEDYDGSFIDLTKLPMW